MGLHTVRTQMDGFISLTSPVHVETSEHRVTFELRRRNLDIDLIP